MKTLVVNMFGGPGTGKSTTATGVFSELKLRGVNCEYVPEFAKDRVWEGTEVVLSNQIYVFGSQHQRLWRLLGKVDIVLTDSPILLSLVYAPEKSWETFLRLVSEEHFKLPSLNVFLERIKPYNPAGRLQNREEAVALDGEIEQVLRRTGVEYARFPAGRGAIPQIADLAQIKFQELNQ